MTTPFQRQSVFMFLRLFSFLFHNVKIDALSQLRQCDEIILGGEGI